MPKIDFDVIFKYTQKLPSLPQTTLQALQMLDDPDYEIQKLAQVIGMDQTLSARLLQWANSPFYGLRYKVSTIEKAIMALGTVEVRDLLLTVSVSEMLNRKMPGYGMERSALWYHSIAVASGAKWLARLNKYRRADRVFIAGLLHDIGKLVLDELLLHETEWQREWLAMQQQGASFIELERWLTGMDHAQLGGRIAEEWQLPAVLVEAIRYHHEPNLATIDPPVTEWVHLADAAALMVGIGLGSDGLAYPVNEDAVKHFNLTTEDFEEMMQIEVEAVNNAQASLSPSLRR
ncbi:MAG TPA: HDOD domain-containing protein [Anaerolineae bacterium]|nr:HDOD domain-containing protein [Anaerolineae bacterium]